jgi:hypothetical protein
LAGSVAKPVSLNLGAQTGLPPRSKPEPNPAIFSVYFGDEDVARKGKSAEEIIATLREAEVRIGQGRRVVRCAGVLKLMVFIMHRPHLAYIAHESRKRREIDARNRM